MFVTLPAELANGRTGQFMSVWLLLCYRDSDAELPFLTPTNR